MDECHFNNIVHVAIYKRVVNVFATARRFYKITAAQQLKLVRNAERVSSLCNDVIGDICGVVSGAAAATIAANILANFSGTWDEIVKLLMSALVAGVTVGGKAIGKTFAIGSCVRIVSFVGKLIWFFHNIPSVIRKKK